VAAAVAAAVGEDTGRPRPAVVMEAVAAEDTVERAAEVETAAEVEVAEEATTTAADADPPHAKRPAGGTSLRPVAVFHPFAGQSVRGVRHSPAAGASS
jgi:hypothetical protein